MLGPEPTLIIQTVVATLVALNTTLVATNTVNLPSWVSPVISALIVGLGALVNRSQVSPVRKQKPRRRRRRPMPTPPPAPPVA